ncbi:hypothetical protein ASE35_03210 [Lysobacter sp. Root916]|uniref:hypothetical protein n=1 Tax=Lysobacter sp. Root916 TaxID=1736606 RepID=UPI000710D4F2|nr:hypothetical protein [Lysobacter sp. Root916]KRD39382.1 hypothetical protein ASE35_03210 [Lysobacter sp. Root916]
MSLLTLRNTTAYTCQLVVLNSRQVIALIPGIAPKAQVAVPTTSSYQITATTVIDGNVYTVAPMDVTGGTGFLAQVLQLASQGIYELTVAQMPSSSSSHLQFQKTYVSPVTFIVSKNGVPLQSVVVNNTFEVRNLDVGDTFYLCLCRHQWGHRHWHHRQFRCRDYGQCRYNHIAGRISHPRHRVTLCEYRKRRRAIQTNHAPALSAVSMGRCRAARASVASHKQTAERKEPVWKCERG